MMKDNCSYLTQVKPWSETIGGRPLVDQIWREKLFQELGITESAVCLWLSRDEKKTICETCWRGKESCQKFRVGGTEFWSCPKCREVFQSFRIEEKTETDVYRFVSTLATIAADHSKIIPENPAITKRLIEYAFLVNGKQLRKQYSNNAEQISNLFRIVRSGSANKRQREKAVSFCLTLAAMFGYESANQQKETLLMV